MSVTTHPESVTPHPRWISSGMQTPDVSLQTWCMKKKNILKIIKVCMPNSSMCAFPYPIVSEKGEKEEKEMMETI